LKSRSTWVLEQPSKNPTPIARNTTNTVRFIASFLLSCGSLLFPQPMCTTRRAFSLYAAVDRSQVNSPWRRGKGRVYRWAANNTAATTRARMITTRPVAAGTHHRSAQLVQPRPRRAVTAQSQQPLQPQRAGSCFLACDIPNCSKPQHQRLTSILKDRPRQQRDL